jgi:hypothetical protein
MSTQVTQVSGYLVSKLITNAFPNLIWGAVSASVFPTIFITFSDTRRKHYSELNNKNVEKKA